MIDRLKPARVALVLVAGVAAQLAAQVPAPATNPPANQVPTPTAARRAAAANSLAAYKHYDEATLERGKKTYSANCAFCHGATAKGGESGPDLLRSVTVLHDENGETLAQVVLNGRMDKGMPKFSFTSEQIEDLAAFLHDRVRAVSQRGTYTILNIVVGDAHAGEAYFNGAGGCTGCHSVTADLAHVGTKYAPEKLQEKIVMPREGRAYGRRTNPNPKQAITATVTPAAGEAVHGYLTRIDDFKVTVTDEKGEAHTFDRDGDSPKVELQDPMAGHFAMLPKYSDADIHNLTAYLVTLK